MKVFCNRFLLFLLPFLVFPLLYIYNDPFKVLYSYHDYYPNDFQIVQLNRDFVSTNVFRDNYSSHYYDSFIFGNSRSIFYEASQWEKQIHSKKIFHFDASGESLYGIYLKFIYLKKYNAQIKNCLLILDNSTLGNSNKNDRGHLYIKSPLLSGDSYLEFHLSFFKAFLNSRFILGYIDYSIFKKFRWYMHGIFEERHFDYDISSNELRLSEFENQIKVGTYKYFLQDSSIFNLPMAPMTNTKNIITYDAINKLTQIKKMFDQDATNYKIILSPIYDRTHLSKHDLTVLKSIFGTKNVFDFSGENFITKDFHNFYEPSHYRPIVTKIILDSLYFQNDEKINNNYHVKRK